MWIAAAVLFDATGQTGYLPSLEPPPRGDAPHPVRRVEPDVEVDERRYDAPPPARASKHCLVGDTATSALRGGCTPEVESSHGMGTSW